MATSGSKTIEIFSWITLTFNWWQNSQSIENNSTNISWNMVLKTNQYGAVYKKNRTWSVTIDGVTQTGQVDVSVDKSSSQTLASGTANVYHNDDGNKTFAYSFSQQFEITLNSGKYMSTYSGSGTDSLTAIPRKSSLSVGNGTLGVTQTLSVTKKASSFTHDILWSCGSASGAVCYGYGITEISWTPPLDLATQAPQDQSVNVTFTINTYNDGTYIDSSTAVANYYIPDEIRPPLIFSLSDSTGYADYYGAYIQGQSRLKVDISTYGVYGSWIKSYRTNFDGKTYTTSPVETDVITGHGSLNVAVTVTDSRERPTYNEAAITVLQYGLPKIEDLSAYRSDGNGNASATGNYITVKFSSSIYKLNDKNGAWFKVRYKKPKDAYYTEVELTNYTGKYIVTNGKYTFAADDFSYDIVLLVGDRFKTVSKSVTGPSVKHTWSFLKKAGEIAGIAWGKIAEVEAFDIGLPVRFSGGFYDPNFDYIVEHGVKDGWTYRKWNSGIGECWKTVSHTTKPNVAWGNMFVGNPSLPRQSYPFPFVSPPVENVTLQSGWYMGMPYADINGNGTNGTHATAIYNIVSLSQVNDNITVYFSISVKGKWK